MSLSTVGENVAFPITQILVPQGAEYQAVCRGLARIENPPSVQPIPVGMQALEQGLILKQMIARSSSSSGILLMGLGGGLDPDLQIGQTVIYQGCCDPSGQEWQGCDRSLVQWLQQRLHITNAVKGLSCDRILSRASEKAELYQKTGLAVVDMEGYAILKTLNAAQIPVAIVRVISDTSRQNLPNLENAIASDGSLKPGVMAWQFAQDPVAAFHLIRSSLKGLGKLRSLAHDLFQPN